MKKQCKVWILMALIVAMIGVVATGCGQDKETSTTNTDSKVELVKVENATYVKYSDNVTAETMSFVKEGDNWLYEADKEAEIIQAMFAENVLVFSNIVGKPVEEGTLEDYYLTEPQYTLEVKNAETSAVIHISENEEGVCYAILDGKEDIYKIDDDVTNAMAFQISGLQEPIPGQEMYGYTQIDDDIVEDDTLIGEDDVLDGSSDIATEDEGIDDGTDLIPEDTPDDTTSDDMPEDDLGSEAE